MIRIVALILPVLMLAGCNYDDDTLLAPVVSFKTDTCYTYNDTTLVYKDSVLVGITAEPSNDLNLTHFNYTILEDSVETSVDSGMNTSLFDYERYIRKSSKNTDKWIFTIRDKGGASASISIVLNLDTLSAIVSDNNGRTGK